MKPRRKLVAEINMVPFIDVMLVLLVIFMITAPLLSQGVNVELPNAAATTLQDQNEPLIVSVNTAGQFFLNAASEPNQPLASQALQMQVAQMLAAAKQQGHTRGVFVKGDKHVDYDKVVQAMVVLQGAGAQSVGLITQTSE